MIRVWPRRGLSATVWLNKPIPALDEEKPLELIARGDYRRVAEIISALEEPVAA